MAKVLKVNNHLFATLLLATVVLVKSLPTSVLVDTKQQHHAEHTASDSLASSKGKNNGKILFVVYFIIVYHSAKKTLLIYVHMITQTMYY